MTYSPLLSICNLTVAAGNGMKVIENVTFDMRPGEILGIVGESGSGKSMTTRAAISLLPPGLRQVSGDILFKGQNVSSMSGAELRKIRGAEIGLVFQEPMTSLNPSMTIGKQLEEALILHSALGKSDRRVKILEMLGRVGIAEPEAALSAYPHEFSGGMRQRIMLASVMLLRPALLIADEPTTALDAIVQRDVMELMVELTQAEGTAVLLISHDLPMVARYTSNIIVMEKGKVVEQGAASELLNSPKHPYTRKLLSSLPFRGESRDVDRNQAPIVSASDIVVDYAGRKSLFGRKSGKRALHGVSVDIFPGEVVALVGGSGSGKTTLGRTIAGLVTESDGTVRFNGRARQNDMADFRRNCQMVFQDPYSSLDPRMTVLDLVKQPLRLESGIDNAERRKRAITTLTDVGLGEQFVARYPHELSGGQRQRVAIARAIVRRPKFLIADEPVSALDVTVRAQILKLFTELQVQYGFSCLFISHDLGVVEQVADRVVVMKNGRIVEEGDRDRIFDAPKHEYTRLLLAAIPALEHGDDGGVKLRWRTATPST